MFLVVALLAAAGAQAAPFIPFDAATQSDGFSYGFQNPGNHGVTTFREFTQFFQAASSSTPEAANSLLHVDPVSFTRCPRGASDGCSASRHVIDVQWDVTLNADVLAEPDRAYEVDLILVDSDPNPIFDGNTVTIDYASASLDGASLDFQTASLNSGSFYFVDLVLGTLLNNETRRIGFSYVVNGVLPTSTTGGAPAFTTPVVLPGAYIFNSTAVPEPGTATLLGFGMTALALRRRRRV